jgi:ribosomal protein S18 acetylase RimI-like enzyme
MQDSSGVEIRLLQESDIAAAMDLKRLAGWNQTETDWRTLLQLEPNGCFAAVLDDQLLGTTTTTSYGSQLAWIGMVLVRPEKRRTGIATKLLQTALSYLEQKVSIVKLDATADGKSVYERIGFEVESLIERWSRKGEPVSFERQPETIDSDTRREILQLDARAFGADRSKLLNLLLANACARLVVKRTEAGSVTGYALARSGSNAAYVGPVVSGQGSDASTLLDQILDQLHSSPAYVDLNRNWGEGQQLLSERGFEKQRDLIRMRRGVATPTSRLVFAIAGPEIG